MKSIIGGLRYDTEQAILIGDACAIGHGCESVTDFGYWEAGLYKTKRAGRFFLAGHGGPMSRFARSSGQNSTIEGEGIIPMSNAEALKWAERYIEPEEFENHFEIKDA